MFTPSEIGDFHLFCAEFCGTQHSHMIGDITVMSRSDYDGWLRRQPHDDVLVRQGEALYEQFGCGACHSEESQVHAPKLAGLFGSTVHLRDGRQITADDAYLRNTILHPRDLAVAGYAPIMPSYGELTDAAKVNALVAYIKSLSPQQAN